ncbi:MAG: hypothetical protein JWM27_4451 [Gemmatimonadetes bacterium]|nr:hypothetical protein [Gemmatimonadota bacterium]
MNRTFLAFAGVGALALSLAAVTAARAQDSTAAPPPQELQRLNRIRPNLPVLARCPQAPANIFVFDTHGTGTVVRAHPLVSVATSAAGANDFSRNVLNIDLGRCKQVNVVVEYEGLPSGWTLDFGDSQTNNGYGGGVPGTTAHMAELQVVNGMLTVHRANSGTIAQVWPVTLQDGALKIVARNQFLSWGQPYAVVPNAGGNSLFALPDLTGPMPDGMSMYLGINRVIYNPGNRVGYGVRRVMITMQ